MYSKLEGVSKANVELTAATGTREGKQCCREEQKLKRRWSSSVT